MDSLMQNIQKGIEKIIDVATVFSAWAREWIDALREQLRLINTRSRIDELHRMIGRRVAEMRKEKTVSSALGQLLKDTEIANALAESATLEKELADASRHASDEDGAESGMDEKKEDDAAA